MIRFWTSDMHLDHTSKRGGVIAYCDRPFKDIEHMNQRLIDEANMRIKSSDVCIHVGDFFFGKSSRFCDLRSLLKGYWTFLRGNHDKNNSVKTIARSMITNIGKYQVFVSHWPYYYDNMVPEEYRVFIEKYCDFALCGHVHRLWKVSHEGKIPTINVGVDVRKFRPMTDVEVIGEYERNK